VQLLTKQELIFTRVLRECLKTLSHTCPGERRQGSHHTCTALRLAQCRWDTKPHPCPSDKKRRLFRHLL